MGIFNKIRKAFRKGGALPHEHGPRVVKMAENINNNIPKKYVEVKIDVVKNPGTSASCACGGGTCGCEERKATYAKAVAEKQKKATATKPAAKKVPAKTTEKKIAIAKDLADTPVAKKPAPKKSPAKPSTSGSTGTTAKKPTPKKK